MAGLTNEYASSLLEAARKDGRLEEFYRSALSFSENSDSEKDEMPPELKEHVRSMIKEHVRPALGRFLELARDELRIVDVEVATAIPMKPEQLAELERNIIKTAKKRVNLKTRIDPSIIGGMRVAIGNYVVDNSIKNQLDQMRETLYERVYLGYENSTR